MSQFTHDILVIEQNYVQAQDIKAKIDVLISKLNDMNNQYVVMLEAQQLLTTVSDANTTAVLDYITGIINKTLGELFPHDSRRIYLEKTMYQGQHAHINIKLTGTNGKIRDIQLQSGTGLRQVISFLFVLSLIEIRKGRRLLLADELLSGLHPEAKRIVTDIITIFAEEGFQFAFVEYGVNNLGKIYLVEKPNEVSTITPMDGIYNNEVFVFNRPPEEVDLSIHVEEAEDRIEA
jgi:hypothetical protein